MGDQTSHTPIQSEARTLSSSVKVQERSRSRPRLVREVSGETLSP